MKLQNHSSRTKRETKSWVRVIEINHCMQNYNKVIITAWHWIKIYTEEYLYLSSVCQYQTPKILIASSISFFIIILFWIFIATHNIMLSVPWLQPRRNDQFKVNFIFVLIDLSIFHFYPYSLKSLTFIRIFSKNT